MTPRVLIYARFSSDLQSAASIEDQTRLGRARAEREGWRVVAEHADRTLSGALRDRAGLTALLAEVERARAYIRRLEVHPPGDDGDPPGITIEGNLPPMLLGAGIGASGKGHDRADITSQLEALVECSVKRDPGARPLVGSGAKPRSFLTAATRSASPAPRRRAPAHRRSWH